MKIEIRKASQKAIIEALNTIIQSYPDTNKRYNASRKYRLALKEIKKQAKNNQSKQ